MSDSMVRIGPVAVPGVPIADKAARAIQNRNMCRHSGLSTGTYSTQPGAWWPTESRAHFAYAAGAESSTWVIKPANYKMRSTRSWPKRSQTSGKTAP